MSLHQLSLQKTITYTSDATIAQNVPWDSPLIMSHRPHPLSYNSRTPHVSLLQLADCSWDQTVKVYHPPSITPKPEPWLYGWHCHQILQDNVHILASSWDHTGGPPLHQYCAYQLVSLIIFMEWVLLLSSHLFFSTNEYLFTGNYVGEIRWAIWDNRLVQWSWTNLACSQAPPSFRQMWFIQEPMLTSQVLHRTPPPPIYPCIQLGHLVRTRSPNTCTFILTRM